MANIRKIRVNNTTYDLRDDRLPDLNNSSSQFLRGDGVWASPTVSTINSEADVTDNDTYMTIEPGTGSAYGYTLLGEKNVTANTTSGSSAYLDNITVLSAWTDAKMIYVRIRDNAGPRAGYFYGSDCFFINYSLANGSTSALTSAGRLIHRYSTSSQWGQVTTTGYGVYAYDINSSGKVRIYTRYNSSYSLKINGTYHVEVYALDWPDGVGAFD